MFGAQRPDNITSRLGTFSWNWATFIAHGRLIFYQDTLISTGVPVGYGIW
jgi:hypothetical protein